MMDIPVLDAPIVRIVFENLSNRSAMQQEFQKDVLHQALHEVYPGVSSFVEQESGILNSNFSSASKAPIVNDKRLPTLNVKCEYCGPVSDHSLFMRGSLSVQKTNKGFKLQFDVSESEKIKSKWIVVLGEESQKFFISARNHIQMGNVLKEDQLEVQSCSAKMNCEAGNSFDTLTEAKEKMRGFLGQKTNRFISTEIIINEKYVSSVPMVLMGQSIKLIYKIKNGLRVETKAKSLSNGAKGELVRVEIAPINMNNESFAKGSLTVLDAVVSAPGMVEYAR